MDSKTLMAMLCNPKLLEVVRSVNTFSEKGIINIMDLFFNYIMPLQPSMLFSDFFYLIAQHISSFLFKSACVKYFRQLAWGISQPGLSLVLAEMANGSIGPAIYNMYLNERTEGLAISMRSSRDSPELCHHRIYHFMFSTITCYRRHGKHFGAIHLQQYLQYISCFHLFHVRNTGWVDLAIGWIV
jgi:hypothetical protein